MKKLLSLVITVFFVVCAAYPAFAMTMPPLIGFDPPPSAVPTIITDICRDYNGRDIFQMLAIKQGESISALSPQLQNDLSYIDCLTDQIDENGQPVYYMCPVTWDLSRSTDTSLPGRIEIHGTLNYASNYTLISTLPNDIIWQAVVQGERASGAEVLSDINVSFLQNSPIPLGEEPKSKISTATCHTSIPGEYFNCDFVWDFSSVQINTAGKYTISGAPSLPLGFALPPNYVAPTRTIVVMPNDAPDLSSALFDNLNGYINCKWLFPLQKENNVKLEYAVNTEEWKQDLQSTYIVFNSYWGNSLNINLNALNEKTDYYFRIRYSEGSADKFSNTLHIRLENKDFLIPNAAPPSFDIGGDRDAGDTGGNVLPPLTQPAPSEPSEIAPPPLVPVSPPPLEISPVPPQDAIITQAPPPIVKAPDDDLKPVYNEEKPTVMEEVTENSTLISGTRLSQLTALSDVVLFEKHGIAVELSSSLLNNLHLTDDNILEVYIQKSENSGFNLAVFADGNAVDALPETTVYMPFDADDGDKLECVKTDGTFVSNAYYEKQNGTAQFELQEGGNYQVRHIKAPVKAPLEAANEATSQTLNSTDNAVASESQSKLPVFTFIAIFGITIGACLYVFVLRRQNE
ncbi:MAG: hypothetical protein RR508_06610 [Oscillospiraceae bacterium]